MTPVDEFNQEVWHVLQRVRRAELATVGKNIEYKFPHVVGVGIIPKEKQKKILYKLQEWEALKVRENPWEPPESTPDTFYLNLLQPKFNKIYQKFTPKASSHETVEDSFIADIQEINVKDIPVGVVISDLNSIYQEIESENDKGQFFIKIAHYGKYILENQSTIAMLNPLYKEAQEDAEPYLKSWKDFVKTWKEYANDIIKIAKKAGIKDDPNNPLSNEIGSIKAHLNNEEPSVWETDIQYYFIPYQTLIWKFGELNKYDLLIPKHLKPVSPDNKEVVIYPLYKEARDSWDKFKVVREAKVWWAHYQICRLAAGILDLAVSKEYFKRDNIIDTFYKFEFDEVARGNTNRSPIMLHEDKYKVWIKRLHNYLIPRLQNVTEISQKADAVDYSDTAKRRGVEKKWNVLQSIWSSYESFSRPDAVMVPVKRIGNLSQEQIDGIIEGFRKEKLFRSWERRDRYYFVEYIDHDVLPDYYDDLKNLYRKYATEYQANVEQTNYVTRNDSAKELTKKELRSELLNIIKTAKFGKKEKSFLKFLAKDFGPKTISQIGEEVGSKACKQLKARVNKRIKNTGFYVETIRAGKWGGQAHYQLKYGTQVAK